jgi:hypothetical protein
MTNVSFATADIVVSGPLDAKKSQKGQLRLRNTALLLSNYLVAQF